MAYPSVTILPVAPSRVGDPANFLVEDSNFLAAFPTFKTQANSLATYTNAIAINYNNWGEGVAANPTPPVYVAFNSLPVAGETGSIFANKSDLAQLSLFNLSDIANDVGLFLDHAQIATNGTVRIAGMPSASNLADPPLRGDAQIAFNSKNFSFMDSAKLYQENMQIVTNYVFSMAFETEDYNVLTGTENYNL